MKNLSTSIFENPIWRRFFNKICLPICCLLAWQGSIFAQSLPDQMHYSADGRRLITGGIPSVGFYDEGTIHVVNLIFSQTNYWTLLTNNYQSGADLGATMVIDGDTLPAQVGVRFKGQTSYSMNQNSQKKSFNITLDFEDATQDVDGYETLNLNNCFQDPSFMREIIYNHAYRNHGPAPQTNYVHLFLNGQNWGLYPNVQQLNKDFLSEWFLETDGTLWRALRTDGFGGPGGGGGGPFGTGSCSLNWLGTDTADYAVKYTLKRTSKPNPWDDLRKVCDELNNTPLGSLEDSIRQYMDLDRALWFLVTENVFADDDSYIHKGGMDYYLYWDPESNLITPLEYDGNTVMDAQHLNWSAFYNADDTDYPLLNRLLAVPSIRQRYLAHLRTLLDESFNPDVANPLIDSYFTQIDSFVENDPKKIYSYNAFLTEKDELKDFIETRHTNLSNNAEVNKVGPAISNVEWQSDGVAFESPDAGEEVGVTASVNATDGVFKATLHYGAGLVGIFDKTPMLDDGAHNDGAANDGVFGASIPGFGNGQNVRFYIEAIANNTPKTATYEPKGAEHDVYVYRVNVTGFVPSQVVVNEIMASNAATVSDQDGEFDDWIELFNTGDTSLDLSGWSLSDDSQNLTKFTFPTGSLLDGGAYLIVWADEDGDQNGLHANFKLSSTGEQVYLTDAALNIAQEVIFGEQTTDLGFARIPNGFGDFVVKDPTFAWNNELPLADSEQSLADIFSIFPNPAENSVTVALSSQLPEQVTLLNSLGQKLLETTVQERAVLDLSHCSSGIYWVRVGDAVRKLVVSR